uniref:Melanin-concentrating hormone n=1 Tax=Salarias fasciatus TaxID=181472 RepID=A0A672JPV7_SALFA
MRQSLTSLVFAAALLFQCYALSVALPTGKSDGDSLEQEAFASLLGDEATENSFGDVDLAAAANAANARGPRMIVVAADPSLWRDSRLVDLSGFRPEAFQVKTNICGGRRHLVDFVRCKNSPFFFNHLQIFFRKVYCIRSGK